MAPRPLLLVGAGGLAREVLAAVHAEPEVYQPFGLLDDDISRHGAVVDGLPVLGGSYKCRQPARVSKCRRS